MGEATRHGGMRASVFRKAVWLWHMQTASSPCGPSLLAWAFNPGRLSESSFLQRKTQATLKRVATPCDRTIAGHMQPRLISLVTLHNPKTSRIWTPAPGPWHVNCMIFLWAAGWPRHPLGVSDLAPPSPRRHSSLLAPRMVVGSQAVFEHSVQHLYPAGSQESHCC